MEAIPNSNKKIYFSGDTSEIISNILKKYSLEETDEELAKKIFGEESFVIPGGVILTTAISLAKKEITEKDAIILLQKDLNILQTIAEGLVNEIKTNLIPLATTKKPVTQKPIEEKTIGEISELVRPIKQPIGVAKVLSQTKDQNENIPLPKISPFTKESVKKGSKRTELKQRTPPQQKRKNDAYREPIE